MWSSIQTQRLRQPLMVPDGQPDSAPERTAEPEVEVQIPVHVAPEPTLESPSSHESNPSQQTSDDVELNRMLKLLQQNLELIVKKTEAQADAYSSGWREAAQTLQKMEAVISLMEDFMGALDEQTDRLVTVTAALITLQEDLANQAVEETQPEQ